MSKLIQILFGVFLICSCSNEKDKVLIEQLIQGEVKKRIEVRNRVSYNRCLEGLYAEASEIADSILLLQARLARDTAGKPLKPVKPEKPEIIELKDSTPIQPFLVDSTSQDSIPIY